MSCSSQIVLPTFPRPARPGSPAPGGLKMKRYLVIIVFVALGLLLALWALTTSTGETDAKHLSIVAEVQAGQIIEELITTPLAILPPAFSENNPLADDPYLHPQRLVEDKLLPDLRANIACKVGQWNLAAMQNLAGQAHVEDRTCLAYAR